MKPEVRARGDRTDDVAGDWSEPHERRIEPLHASSLGATDGRAGVDVCAIDGAVATKRESDSVDAARGDDGVAQLLTSTRGRLTS